MKKLHFSEPSPRKILEGRKYSTWRIDDEKNIAKGDRLSLCYNDGKEFAKAEVTDIKEKSFEDLTEEDKQGHEKYSSDKEMYKTYSRYYKTNISPETKVKIIKFKLI